jgi:excisionase family DNA binding protein
MAEQNYTNWDEIPLVLTTDEAAGLLRVHVNTVKYLIRNGKLPATKIGRAWRIPREAVLAVRGGETNSSTVREVALDLLSALRPFAALCVPGTSDERQHFIPTGWIQQAQAAVQRAEASGLSGDGLEEKE